MPSLQHLNPNPNPFWDFVAGLEDHPFFAGRAGPPSYTSRENVASQAAEASGSGEQTRDKQPTAEDPPEVDPATLSANANANESHGAPWGGPWGCRGHFANTFEGGDEPPHRGRGCHGRGGFESHGGPHRGGPMGPPPFMFGRGGPWWARHVPGMDNPEHPHPHEDPHHGPGPHHGPPHHGPPHHGPGPHHHRGPPGHFRGRGGCNRRQSPSSRHGPPGGFNLGEFLNNLGNRLGVDLSGAAEGLGLDRFTGPRANAECDFEPRGDIFDTAAQYIIHLSLPGARKEDVGVDWDGENSVLRIAGVVHRPGADEELLSALVVDQRRREVGVFEKSIRLGTKRDPAGIDVAGIAAKMTDGVLVVSVPKVEVEHRKRDVPITGSPPARKEKEKDSLLDAADEEMYDAASASAPAAAAAAAPLAEKEQIAEHAHEQDTRSETMDVEHHDEKAPAYEEGHGHGHEHDHDHDHADEESDWEKDGSEDEGEYVKINVD